MNDNNRLDRIEAALELTQQQTDINALAISELRVGLADVRSAAESLLQVVTIHQQNFEAMQLEIRGLQLENRRLFERFFPDETQE